MRTGRDRPRRTRSRVSAKHLVGLLLLSAAINVPFIGQAFHIDDGVFLHVAENVSRHPFFSQDVPLQFEGITASDLASTEHPPLTAYYMALAAAVGGEFSETVLHVAFLLFPIILTAATCSLACRFTGSPVIATLAVLATPVVYVMSHTLMTDVPLLAVWAAALALFIDGVDSGRRRRLWAGALAASLAVLISYTGFCLVPLLAAYALLHRSRIGFLAMLLPIAVFGTWLGLNYAHFGRFTPAPLLIDYLVVRKVPAPGLLVQKLIYAVVVLGGVILFPLALWFLGKWKRAVAGLAFALTIVTMTAAREYDLPEKLIFVVLFTAGFLGIWEIGSRFTGSLQSFRGRSEGDTDDLFLGLGLWFLGALTFCVLFYLTGAARHFLSAVLPFVLMTVRRTERLAGEKVRRFVVPALLATGSLALALGIADYQFAGIYRDFAGSVRRVYAKPNQTIWFTGEWGFRTYLERLGGRELGRRDPPAGKKRPPGGAQAGHALRDAVRRCPGAGLDGFGRSLPGRLSDPLSERRRRPDLHDRNAAL